MYNILRIGPLPQPQRKVILEVFNEIKTQIKDKNCYNFKEAKKIVERLMDESTPAYHFSNTTSWAMFNLNTLLSREKMDLINALATATDEVLKARGFRDDIQTWQEHALLGSTVWIGYKEKPYLPIGIFKGEVSIEEVKYARELELCFASHRHYYGVEDENLAVVKIVNEALDSAGNTIRDPRPVIKPKFGKLLESGMDFEKAVEFATLIHKKSSDYPLRRD